VSRAAGTSSRTSDRRRRDNGREIGREPHVDGNTARPGVQGVKVNKITNTLIAIK
jgi:hypothetical protein